MKEGVSLPQNSRNSPCDIPRTLLFPTIVNQCIPLAIDCNSPHYRPRRCLALLGVARRSRGCWRSHIAARTSQISHILHILAIPAHLAAARRSRRCQSATMNSQQPQLQQVRPWCGWTNPPHHNIFQEGFSITTRQF